MIMKCSVLFLVSVAVYGVSSADRALKRYPRQVEYAEVGNAASAGSPPFGPGNYAIPQFGQSPPRPPTSYPGDLSPFLSSADGGGGAIEGDRKASRQTRKIDGFAPDNFPLPTFRQEPNGPPSSTVILPDPTTQLRSQPNSFADYFPPTSPPFQTPVGDFPSLSSPQRPPQFSFPVTPPRPSLFSSPVTPQRPARPSVTASPRRHFSSPIPNSPSPPALHVQPSSHNNPIPPFALAFSGGQPSGPPQTRPDSLSLGFDEGRLSSNLPARPDVDIIPQRTQPNLQAPLHLKNEPAPAYNPISGSDETVVLPTPGQSFRNLRQPINTVAVPPQSPLPAGSPIGAVVAPFPFGDADDTSRRPVKPPAHNIPERRPVRPSVEPPPRPQSIAPSPRPKPVAPPTRPQPVPFPRQLPEIAQQQQDISRQSHTRRGPRTHATSLDEPNLPTSRSRPTQPLVNPSAVPSQPIRSTVPPSPPKRLTLPNQDSALVPPNRRSKPSRTHSVSSSPLPPPPATSPASSVTSVSSVSPPSSEVKPTPRQLLPDTPQSPSTRQDALKHDLAPIEALPVSGSGIPVALPPGVPATYDPNNPYPVPRKPLPGPAPPQPLPGNTQLPILDNIPYPKPQQEQQPSPLSKKAPTSTSIDNHNHRRKKQLNTSPVSQDTQASRSPISSSVESFQRSHSPSLTHEEPPLSALVSSEVKPNQDVPNRPKNKRRSKNRRRPTTLSPLPDAADITTAALSTTTLPPPLSMPSTLAGLNIGPLPSPPQSLEGPPPPLSVLTPETSTQRPDQVHPKRRRGRRRKNRNQRQDKSESNLDGSTEGSSSGLTISEIGSGALQDGPTASRGRRVRNRL
ncbi:proline-rich extensin-like protein EPR1 isoform X1 [Varroa destructor]|uniref:Uncharacterized protein n=1 Tax=Varroa destructor TaxID=109461 RepID=A0A7M7MBA9_VARDE|nr:proline-rich extensin-like protein EPR1 isoform X1 [Varroa destructor]